MASYILRKLRNPRVKNELFKGRFFEPIHLNLYALFVAIFGSYQRKIECDLVPRLQYAAGLMDAVKFAKKFKIKEIAAIEFGVAAGDGLINMAKIAAKLTEVTGVKIRVYGFDTGEGMPDPIDYRDHPERWQPGDFPMEFDALKKRLPSNAELILGNVAETAPSFVESLPEGCRIGFVAVDVDYYSSTVSVLKLLEQSPEYYLPILPVYLDDIKDVMYNNWCGELLAVNEFNDRNQFRKIEFDPFLPTRRLFRRATWIRKLHYLHVLDHEVRSVKQEARKARVLENPYI